MRLAASAATIILAAALASCSSSLPAGPFWEPRDHSVQCAPLAGHEVATFGDVGVRNSGRATAVIDKIALAKPKGLQLLRVWAVPTTGSAEGMSWGFPPPPFHVPGWHWDHRHLAGGARVLPSAGQDDSTNLLAVVALAPGVPNAALRQG